MPRAPVAQSSGDAPGAPRAYRPVTTGGQRLLTAFAALERFPALSHSRDHLLALTEQVHPAQSELVEAVESDPALAVGVLRAANRRPEAPGGGPADLPNAIRVLSRAELAEVARGVVTFEFFERARGWYAEAERFRLHALATRGVAERFARTPGIEAGGEVLAACLLHDIGKLVMLHAYREYPAIAAETGTPEERLRLERRELGIDHASVGGVLARRLGLPVRVAKIIQDHHDPEARGPAAVVRLADMVSHYLVFQPVDAGELIAAGEACGLDADALRSALYALSLSGERREFDEEPCPLSARELEILALLGRGMRYKQIAAELGLATSTVRTHLHTAYRKIGVDDRAQAVLVAKSRGWI